MRIAWLLNGPLLGLLVIASAFAVIFSTHMCRSYYTELQALETARWALEEDYGRLLIERSTLASPHRVLQVATQELYMIAPTLERRRVVSP